jgi:hypothetical protein
MSRGQGVALLSAAALAVPLLGAARPGDAPGRSLRARAYEFVGEEGDCGADAPAGSRIVQAEWLDGLGLPDAGGSARSGLLLSKNGPTADCSAAVVRIHGIAGEAIDELGFDYRNGSHCGGGAPRFGVVSREGFYYFVGCASGTKEPAPPDEGQWTRVRFGPRSFVPSSPEAPPFELGVTPVDRLYVVFDEGTDATSAGNPAGSGLAILDNIDVNGELIERGD